MEFYLLKNGERAGPFKIFHVVEMLRSDEVKDTDMAWCSVDDDWMPIRDIPAMKGLIGDSIEADEQAEEAEIDVLPISERHTRNDDEVASARPWMRFLARVLDCSLAFHVLAFVAVQVGFAAPATFTQTSTDLLTMTGLWMLSTYAWAFIEAWFLSKYGATVGKFLFNLRVLHEDGSLLTYKEALRRSLTVCVRGYGLGIFPLREMLSAIAFIALVQDGKTPWDEKQSLKVSHGGMNTPQWVTLFAVMIGLLTLKSFVVYNIDPEVRKSVDEKIEEMEKSDETSTAFPFVINVDIEFSGSIS